MEETKTWKKRVSFESGDSGAWAGLVELLEQKEIGLDGKSPIYIRFPDWEGDIRDYIEVSNSPIGKKAEPDYDFIYLDGMEDPGLLMIEFAKKHNNSIHIYQNPEDEMVVLISDTPMTEEERKDVFSG